MSTIRIATKLTKNLRLDYIKSTLDANWKYFVSKKAGEIVNTIINESSKTIMGFIDTVNFLSSFMQSFIIFISVFFISYLVGSYALIVGIIYLFVFKIWGVKAKKYGLVAANLSKKISASLFDGFKNIKTVKITGFTNVFFYKLKEIVSSSKENDIRLFQASAFPEKEPFFAIFISIGLYFAFNYEVVALTSLIALLALFQRSISKLSLADNIYLKKNGAIYEGYFKNLNHVKILYNRE